MKRVFEESRSAVAKYKPPIKFRKIDLPYGRTITRFLIDTIEMGECRKITHKDVACDYTKYGDNVWGSSCSLVTMCWAARKEGKRFEHYHEDNHIAIVRRLK